MWFSHKDSLEVNVEVEHLHFQVQVFEMDSVSHRALLWNFRGNFNSADGQTLENCSVSRETVMRTESVHDQAYN